MGVGGWLVGETKNLFFWKEYCKWWQRSYIYVFPCLTSKTQLCINIKYMPGHGGFVCLDHSGGTICDSKPNVGFNGNCELGTGIGKQIIIIRLLQLTIVGVWWTTLHQLDCDTLVRIAVHWMVRMVLIGGALDGAPISTKGPDALGSSQALHHWY